MKLRHLFLFCVICCSVSISAQNKSKLPKTSGNPIFPGWYADPEGIVFGDEYWIYPTYSAAYDDQIFMDAFSSKDLVNWTKHPKVLSKENISWLRRALWAPAVIHANDKYYFFFGANDIQNNNELGGIGVAVADNPAGPFKDHGMMFRSNEIGVQNSIDPFYIEDNGRKYLFWGSFRGIYGVELKEDGLAVKLGAEKKQIAGTAYEGTYIHKRNGYYYMFASTGTCCEGLKSTYQTVVGRSKSLWGPYLNKQGKTMLENNHEVLISKNKSFVGTGHNAELVTDKAGNDWILYHGVSVANPHGRVLLLDRVNWKKGWPIVKNNSASTEAKKPKL